MRGAAIGPVGAQGVAPDPCFDRLSTNGVGAGARPAPFPPFGPSTNGVGAGARPASLPRFGPSTNGVGAGARPASLPRFGLSTHGVGAGARPASLPRFGLSLSKDGPRRGVVDGVGTDRVARDRRVDQCSTNGGCNGIWPAPLRSFADSPSKRGPHRDRGTAGFTLIEVMVALMIFGMLAAAGVAILSYSVRAQAVTGVRLDEVSAMNRTVAILSADLAQALDRPARDQGGTLLPALVGEATTLSLVRGGWSNVDAAPRPGEQKVVYRVADGALQRVAFPMLDGAAPLDPAALVDRVQGIRLRYRYRGAWSDRWDGAGGAPLPDAVEMALVRDGGVAWRQLFMVGTGYGPAQPPAPVASPTPGAS